LLIVVICIGGIVAAILISKSSEKGKEMIEVHDDGTVDVAGNDTFVILDAEDAAEAEEIQKQAAEGRMNLDFKNVITIENGKNGICDISNPETNNYDMYVSIWLNDTQEEIYRSGLIPLGAKIEQLELNRLLEPGEYTGIMVYNQLENNKIVSQVNVEVTLKVLS
jgi:hypothetical protein